MSASTFTSPQDPQFWIILLTDLFISLVRSFRSQAQIPEISSYSSHHLAAPCLFPFTWNAHCAHYGALPLFTIQAGYSSYPCFSPLDQIPSLSLALSLRSINQVIFFLQLCNLLRHKLDFAHTYWKMIPWNDARPYMHRLHAELLHTMVYLEMVRLS